MRWGGRIVAVLLVVGCSYFFEEIKNHFPDLIDLQLQSYNWLIHRSTGTLSAKHVVGVEIDNDTFYRCLGLESEDDVTNRAFLAGVVNSAVDAGAAVIALDVSLTHEAPDRDDDKRKAENQALFDAIARAREKNVPVVIGMGFDYKAMQPLPNIEDDPKTKAAAGPHSQCCLTANTPAPEQPPASRPEGSFAIAGCDRNWLQSRISSAPATIQVSDPRAGFDVAPEDRRKVPLMVDATMLVEDPHRPSILIEVECPSFALQVADAYEKKTYRKSVTVSDLQGQIKKRKFVYATFIPEYSHFDTEIDPSILERFLNWMNGNERALAARAPQSPKSAPLEPDPYQFPHVSARDIYNHHEPALSKLQGQIALIGGHRTSRDGSQEWIDYHSGPEGPMVGMYIQANYIEALLDENRSGLKSRLKFPVGRGLGVVVDLGIAALIMFAGGVWAHRWYEKFAVLLLAIILAVLLYVWVLHWRYSLDVLAVLLIMFLHSAWEHYFYLQECRIDLRSKHA